MSELKPGDKVWIGVNVGLVLTDNTAWYTDLRGAPIKGCFDTSYVPDVPNLAAVARVLAAHPGIGEALARIEKQDRLARTDFSWPDGKELPIGDPRRTKIVLDGTREYVDAVKAVTADDIALLGLLAAALNGGTA